MDLESWDKEELITMVDLLIMGKIRNNCSQEFVVIVDKAIECEVDVLKDLILQEDDIKHQMMQNIK